jgi:hypothetical protein
MWGSSLWQKFIICFSLCFFAIWISTLATWVTIYNARQEGQGTLTAPFKKLTCGTMRKNNFDAIKTAAPGVFCSFACLPFKLKSCQALRGPTASP